MEEKVVYGALAVSAAGFVMLSLVGVAHSVITQTLGGAIAVLVAWIVLGLIVAGVTIGIMEED